MKLALSGQALLIIRGATFGFCGITLIKER